jgi:hypothetical protein
LNQQIKYIDFIEQYAELNEDEQAQYQANYLKKEAEGDRQMGLVQLLREEGRQTGEAELFLRLAKMKFDNVPDDIEQKVKAATSQQLLTWSEKLLTADDLGEIFD